ncbi:TIGR03086 family metal-binding protein [Kineococcus glutinatus]|uniref:TIGR03086 family metal-binding protein n=1 Tax=Kineococcus glutinatus TaxID=1070872 RepID=A0ABP9I4E2_9ACTN
MSSTSATAPAAAPATDPRPAMRRALDQLDRLVAAVGADDLTRPTPCTDLDVRALLEHLLGVARRIAHVARGGAALDVPSSLDGPADGGWVAAWAGARADAEEAWADDAVLTRVLELPFGTMPGAAAGFAYVQEFTVHAGDLATALGRAGELDEELAAQVLAGAVRFLPAEPRGGRVPFGPVVAVADSAPASERLAGWTGRTPA